MLFAFAGQYVTFLYNIYIYIFVMFVTSQLQVIYLLKQLCHNVCGNHGNQLRFWFGVDYLSGINIEFTTRCYLIQS